jgi:signal transduction histidine kinase
MKLAGALGIGYLEAYHTKQRKLNVRELRKVRHDLKTPINAVTGFSKVILKGIDGPITKLQQEDLTTIFESGLQLLEMIDDLTTTIIRDEDKIALTTDTIDVAALIGDIIATAYPVINSRSCSLNVHLSDELGVLDAPLSPIRWVLLSPLLVLARAAQQHTVTLQISRSDIKNQELIIARITTEGISPEMFEKVKKAPTLVPTQRYCRKMGGTFELSADEGDGVCIYVQIPTVVPKDIM